MLKCLPDVLRLSLAGIEPSDVRKTALVLHLYSTILAWLPTVRPPEEQYCGGTVSSSSTFDDDDDDAAAPPLRSYIELIEDRSMERRSSRSSSSPEEEKKKKKEEEEDEDDEVSRKDEMMMIRIDLSSSEINDQCEELSQYMCQEWCDALLKKLFALLEAQEGEVEGAASSPITGQSVM